MKDLLPGLAGLALLAACVPYTEIETPPQRVEFTSASVQAAAFAFNEIDLRTVLPAAEDQGAAQEVLGVPCTLSGTGFSARVTSPARIEVPSFLGAADPIDVTCQSSELQGRQGVPPVNLALERGRNGAVVAGGLLGALVYAAAIGTIQATRDPANDEFAYVGEIRVPLAPRQ